VLASGFCNSSLSVKQHKILTSCILPSQPSIQLLPHPVNKETKDKEKNEENRQRHNHQFNQESDQALEVLNQDVHRFLHRLPGSPGVYFANLGIFRHERGDGGNKVIAISANTKFNKKVLKLKRCQLQDLSTKLHFENHFFQSLKHFICFYSFHAQKRLFIGTLIRSSCKTGRTIQS
jgi:hypothetical protein